MLNERRVIAGWEIYGWKTPICNVTYIRYVMRIEQRNIDGSGFNGWYLVDGERTIRLQATSIYQNGSGRPMIVHLIDYYRGLQNKELGRYEDICGKSFDIDEEERGAVMSKKFIKFLIENRN